MRNIHREQLLVAVIDNFAVLVDDDRFAVGYFVQLGNLGLHIADIGFHGNQSDRIPQAVDNLADNGIGVACALQIGGVRLGAEEQRLTA
ncbi:hypothetical protein D3C75_974490 [compost metagenome]